MSVLVMGLGLTGESIARHLQKRGREFCLFDTREHLPHALELQKRYQVPLYLKEFPEAQWHQIESLMVSPGVDLDIPLIQMARARNIPIIGDIECFAKEVRAPVIAITGTNGKSTVTSLVGEMAHAAGIKVAVAGNIGTPVLDRLDEGEDYELWVLELSSFQLDLVFSLAPLAATILNITPDHLDRHHTLAAYIAAKQQIYHHAQYKIFDEEEPFAYPSQESNGHIPFTLQAAREGVFGCLEKNGRFYLAFNQEPWLAFDEMAMKGRHNWRNALAACALAKTCHISKEVMVNTLKHFKGLKHRCELVRTRNHVDWIDDSKGTNVGATTSAIEGIGGAITGKIVLIAGGIGKDADFSVLQSVVRTYVRSVILIGQDAQKIADALENQVPTFFASSMIEAVSLAERQASPGDCVLLSPACASFDMFKDYHHRGEVFHQAVSGL